MGICHKMFFFDTNFPMSHTFSSLQKEMTHGYWENHLCPAYGLFTGLRISQMCSTIQWPLQSQTLFLLESISLYGLCTTHLSGKPERHRGLSPFSSTKTLSYGFSWQGLPQHSGSCQSDQGLANLCRFCPDPHRPSTSPLRQRFLRCRIGSNGLRLGLHHHRSVSLLFPWAKFRTHKAAVKLHTLLDLRGSIPSLIIITHGKVHDVNILDQLSFEPGAFYIIDRGYLDFDRLYAIHQASALFVTRAKSNFRFRRLYSRP